MIRIYTVLNINGNQVKHNQDDIDVDDDTDDDDYNITRTRMMIMKLKTMIKKTTTMSEIKRRRIITSKMTPFLNNYEQKDKYDNDRNDKTK